MRCFISPPPISYASAVSVCAADADFAIAASLIRHTFRAYRQPLPPLPVTLAACRVTLVTQDFCCCLPPIITATPCHDIMPLIWRGKKYVYAFRLYADIDVTPLY